MSQEQALTGLRRAGVFMGAKAAAEPASASTAVAREIIVLERTMSGPSHTYECFNLSYYENMFCKHRGIVVDLSTKIALNFGLSVYIGIPSVYPFGLQVKSGRNCK